MKQFSLKKYLENPSRKVVTKSGHNVRILCTDQRGNMPIVALVEFETLDGVQLFYHDGKNESHREYDLFFADEEEEPQSIEELLGIIILQEIEYWRTHDKILRQDFNERAKQILDLARKELLKDLPKLKKATKHEDLEKHIAILEDGKVLLSNYLEEGDYYIDLEDLKTLPKED